MDFKQFFFIYLLTHFQPLGIDRSFQYTLCRLAVSTSHLALIVPFRHIRCRLAVWTPFLFWIGFLTMDFCKSAWYDFSFYFPLFSLAVYLSDVVYKHFHTLQFESITFTTVLNEGSLMKFMPKLCFVILILITMFYHV